MIKPLRPGNFIEGRSIRVRCEAVPSFDLDQAFRRLKTNQTGGVRWMSSDGRGLIGQGGFRNHHDHVNLVYRFGGQSEQSELSINIVETSNGVTSKRRRAMCPNCHSIVSRIYYVNTYWACRSCHRLAYGSQLKTHQEDLTDKWYSANFALKLPRKAGEHRKTYETRIAKARATLDSMKHYPRVGEDGPPATPTIAAVYWAGTEEPY